MTFAPAGEPAWRRSRRLVWIIPAALALHNAEEALTFARYLPDVRARLPASLLPFAATIDVASLRVALLWATAIPLIVAALAVWRWHSPIARWSAVAVQGVVALNVLSHVAVATWLLHGYAPGLVTALTVNAPVSVLVFGRARRERWFGTRGWWLLPLTAFLLHGPGLLGLLMLS